MRRYSRSILLTVTLLLIGFTYADGAVINVPDDYQVIQDAVNAASPGDTVLLQPGTYNEGHIAITTDIVFGSLMITTGDPQYISSTIIDGGGQFEVLYLANLTSNANITGFTIRNGRYGDGGGIYNRGGGPVLSHLVVHDCVGTHFGGGLSTFDSNITVRDCEFYNNSARDGGGIAIQNSDGNTINLERVVIHHNEADWGGGIRLLYECEVIMDHVLIYDNEADHGGGINCYGNGVEFELVNGTLHGNSTGDGTGGGIKMWGATTADIVNTIIDDNLPNNLNNRSGSSSIFIAYSDIVQGLGSIDNNYPNALTLGNGMIYADPLFVDPDNFDFHLTANSPAVNSGDPNSPQDPDGTRADMGYYYFHQVQPLEVELTYPDGGEEFGFGEIVNVTWTVDGGVGTDYSVVRFSDDDGDSWSLVDTTWGNDLDLSWTVPNQASSECLLRVTVVDTDDNEASDESDAQFTIQMPHMEQSVSAGWSLISIPLIQNDMSVNEVLGDDFVRQFVVYGFEPDQGHTEPDVLENGKGYFLGTVSSATMDVDGMPNDDDSFTFDLVWGWNVLGGPFRYVTPLSEATVTVTRNGEEESFDFDDAVDDTIVSPIMYNFFDNVPEGEPDWPQGNHYQEHDAFQLWRGYWYLCLEDSVSLTVYQPQPGPEPLPYYPQVYDWYLQLYANSSESGDNARIGVTRGATSGFDNRFDYPEPPTGPIENYVRMYFNHQEWNWEHGSEFNRDIRSRMDRDETRDWTLTIQTDSEGEIDLFWPEIFETIPWMNEYTLIDPDEDVEIDMLSEYVYTFQCDGSKELVIRVHYSLGVEDNTPDMPQTFGLVSVHPNPFNARTTIEYVLLAALQVRMSVFDLVGREVSRLVDGTANAGYHNVTWQASEVESGIYFVRFTGPDFNQTRRLILLK